MLPERTSHTPVYMHVNFSAYSESTTDCCSRPSMVVSVVHVTKSVLLAGGRLSRSPIVALNACDQQYSSVSTRGTLVSECQRWAVMERKQASVAEGTTQVLEI